MVSKYCSKIIKWGVYAAVLLTPLLVNIFSNTAFEVIKSVAFRGIVEIVVLAYVIKAAQNFGMPYKGNDSGSSLGNKIVISAIICMIITVLSWMNGINLYLGFFGSYLRSQGLLTLIHYWALFGVILAEFRTVASLWGIMRAACVGGFIVALIGVFQMVGFDMITFMSVGQSEGVARISSTMGQPNFLGQYLIMLMPFVVAMLVMIRGKSRSFYYGVFAAMFIAMLGTLSRSAWLGFIGAGVFFGFAYMYKIRSFSLMKRVIYGMGISLIALVFVNVVDTPLKSDDAHPMIRRITKVFDSSGATSKSRFYNWYTAYDVLGRSPMFGFGPESYNYLYSKYQPEEILKYEKSSKFADRAHNIFLDRAIVSGYAGLFSSIAFGLLFLYVSIAALLRVRDKESVWLLLACISSMIAFFISDLFGFATTAVSSIYWTVLAISVGVVECSRGKRGDKMERKNTPFGLMIVYSLAIGVLLSAIIDYNVSLGVADVRFKNGICTTCKKENVGIARKIAPYIGYYGFFDAYYLVRQAGYSSEKDALEMLKKAEGILDDSFTKTQRAGDYYLNRARMYKVWEKYDASKSLLAEEAFAMASGATPKKPALYKEWAEYLVDRGLYERAMQVYEVFARLYHPAMEDYKMNEVLGDYSRLAKEVGDLNIYRSVSELYFMAEKNRMK